MTPPRQVQNIEVHFDNNLGYARGTAILVDGHLFPVQEVTIVESAEPPGYALIRVSLAKVRIIVDPNNEEEDEFD